MACVTALRIASKLLPRASSHLKGFPAPANLLKGAASRAASGMKLDMVESAAVIDLTWERVIGLGMASRSDTRRSVSRSDPRDHRTPITGTSLTPHQTEDFRLSVTPALSRTSRTRRISMVIGCVRAGRADNDVVHVGYRDVADRL